MVRIKRAYEAASREDGTRVLVDRLWPRGVSKARAKIDVWLKEIAPSPALRKWFGHDPAKWAQFGRKYKSELAAQREALASLRARSRRGTVTLVYGARDEEHNGAVVLKRVLESGRGGQAR